MNHLHHKIPKHMGGTDDPSNLMEVTVEEHAELHFALYLEYGKWEDWIASMGLSGQLGKEEVIKSVLSESGKKGGGHNRGRKHSTEHLENLRRAVNSPKNRKHLSEKGRLHSAGRHWFINEKGEKTFARECPDGYEPGYGKQANVEKKAKHFAKCKHWHNPETGERKFCVEQPDGFVAGRGSYNKRNQFSNK